MAAGQKESFYTLGLAPVLISDHASPVSLRTVWAWACHAYGCDGPETVLASFMGLLGLQASRNPFAGHTTAFRKRLYMYVYIYIDIGDRLQYGKKWESEIISLLAFFASCLKIVFRNNIYLSYACGGWEFAEGCLFLLMTVKAQVLHHDPFVTKVTHKIRHLQWIFWTPTSSQDTSFHASNWVNFIHFGIGFCRKLWG